MGDVARRLAPRVVREPRARCGADWRTTGPGRAKSRHDSPTRSGNDRAESGAGRERSIAFVRMSLNGRRLGPRAQTPFYLPCCDTVIFVVCDASDRPNPWLTLQCGMMVVRPISSIIIQRRPLLSWK